MLSSFLAGLIITTQSLTIPNIILDTPCNVSNPDCSDLLTLLVDVMNGNVDDSLLNVIKPKCNTDDGYCSIDCSGWLEPVCWHFDTSLYCDDMNGWCAADLTCNTSDDCMVYTMGKCSSSGICIPTASAGDCMNNSDCATDGFGYCDTQTYSGVTVSFCGPEKCKTSNECLTSGYLCGEFGFCVPPCQTAGESGCPADTYGEGRECDVTTGVCEVPFKIDWYETNECDYFSEKNYSISSSQKIKDSVIINDNSFVIEFEMQLHQLCNHSLCNILYIGSLNAYDPFVSLAING
eukprot:974887_1